jgi:hypothetical protein
MTEASKAEGEEVKGGNATDAAVIQVREIVKWLIGAFAAIGVALAAGSQLSDIGHIEGHRLLIAFGGVAATVIGIAVAIFFATKVLTPRAVGLSELAKSKRFKSVREEIDKDPSLLQDNGTSVQNFIDRREKAIEEEGKAWDALYADEDNAAKKTLAQRRSQQRERLDETMTWLFSYARYREVSKLFSRSLWVMGAAAVLAAIGITAFAWAAHPEAKSDKPTPVVAKAPAEIVIDLSADGRKQLVGELGSACDTSHLSALALAGEPQSLEVVTVPGKSCSLKRFILTSDLGTFQSRESVLSQNKHCPHHKHRSQSESSSGAAFNHASSKSVVTKAALFLADADPGTGSSTKGDSSPCKEVLVKPNPQPPVG